MKVIAVLTRKRKRSYVLCAVRQIPVRHFPVLQFPVL